MIDPNMYNRFSWFLFVCIWEKKEPKGGAHQLPHEENLCISLVDNFHVLFQLTIVWREVHGGWIKTLVQIQLFIREIFTPVFHHM